jgi:hypothetical protein
MSTDKDPARIARLLWEALIVGPSSAADDSVPADVATLRAQLEKLMSECDDDTERKAIADQLAVLSSFDPGDAER